MSRALNAPVVARVNPDVRGATARGLQLNRRARLDRGLLDGRHGALEFLGARSVDGEAHLEELVAEHAD